MPTCKKIAHVWILLLHGREGDTGAQLLVSVREHSLLAFCGDRLSSNIFPFVSISAPSFCCNLGVYVVRLTVLFLAIHFRLEPRPKGELV